MQFIALYFLAYVWYWIKRRILRGNLYLNLCRLCDVSFVKKAKANKMIAVLVSVNVYI